MHTVVMSDLLHDHLSLGFHPGCPACEQTVAALAADPKMNDVETLALVAV